MYLAYFLSIITFISVSCSNQDPQFSGSIKYIENTENLAPAVKKVNTSEKDKRPSGGLAASEILVKKSSSIRTLQTKIISSYTASQVLEGSHTITLDNLDVETAFQLSKKYAKGSRSYNQITLPKTTNTFKQGTDGKVIEDKFSQVTDRGIVDILIVVDNSGSMGQEQANLATKLNQLLTEIADTNWKIAVTSTTKSENCQIQIISKNSENYEAKFSAAIKQGLNGSADERGIYQARMGLDCFRKNGMRSDSTLAVLIISDEDNCSNGNCNGDPDGNISYLTSYVENTLQREIGREAGFYGIFSKDRRICPTAHRVARTYESLLAYKERNYTVSAASRFGSICDNDYSTTLKSISNGIASQVKTRFELSNIPDDIQQLKIIIESNKTNMLIPKSEYTLTGRTLSFKVNHEPPTSSLIKVQYVTGAMPKYKNFNLASKPVAKSVRVNINGADLDPSMYTVSERDLLFNELPQDGADITVSYSIDLPLNKSFPLDGIKIKENSLMVLINKKRASEFFFENGMIKFEKAPAESSEIVVKYTQDLGPKLDYTVLVVGNNPRNFRLYKQDKEIPFIQNGLGQFGILPGDFDDNETIKVSYEIDNNNELSFLLPHLPIEGTVNIDSDYQICREDSDFLVEFDRISTQCPVIDQTDFAVTYQYLSELDSFPLTGPYQANEIELKVFVDGKENTEFSIEDGTIKLLTTPPLGANVQIVQNVL